MIHVTVWNENLHEQRQEEVRSIYPGGIHGCLAAFLSVQGDLQIRTATFDEPEHGLTREVLDWTDVLIYWSHMAQEEFSDEVAERIHKAVLGGMGLIALHSAHYSKMLRRILGTSMTLKWRHGDRERLFVTAPAHPIARDLPEVFELPVEEMYGEYFDIPKPDDCVFTGWFAGGEVFRSGVTFQRGLGRIFYFQPGHETYPTYHNPNIQKIITNAVYWCRPVTRMREGLYNREVPISSEQSREGAAPAGSRDIRLSVFYEHLREAGEQTGKSFEELLAAAKDAGIQGVEMEYSTMLADPSLCRKIQEAGMEISNVYQFFEFGKRFAAGMHQGRKMIDLAARLGIRRVMIIPGFLEEEGARKLRQAGRDYGETADFMSSNSEILSMKEALEELVEYAAERKVRVSMEDFDSYDSPIARMNSIKWFLDQIPGLQHTLDMGNYVFSDENVWEAYALMEGSIGHVHCKDRGEEPENQEELREKLVLLPGEKPRYRKGLKPVPVGEGYLPIGELVRKLRDTGYSGYLAIEHFGAPDQLDFMLRSAEYLHRVLSQ